jgi:hypothetical protein
MFYMQNKLIESIQQDRHREAAAERLNASMRPPKQSRRFAISLPAWNTVRSSRAAMPPTIG